MDRIKRGALAVWDWSWDKVDDVVHLADPVIGNYEWRYRFCQWASCKAIRRQWAEEQRQLAVQKAALAISGVAPVDSVIIGIDYDEATRRYDGISLRIQQPHQRLRIEFTLDDPALDWLVMEALVASLCNPCPIMCSSSVDDFVMDVPGWRYDDGGHLQPDPDDPALTGK